MISAKVKTFIFVFVLFLFVGIISVGCKKKTDPAWVNTNSLPGNTFTQYTNNNNVRPHSSAIVYLGSNNSDADVKFGPKDISFEFKSLK